jgi:hypothetical protein
LPGDRLPGDKIATIFQLSIVKEGSWLSNQGTV